MAVPDFPNLSIIGPRIEPQHIACAVAIEVTDAYDTPARRMRADIDTAGPVSILDQPELDITRRGIEPENVTRAIVIEIADPGRNVSGRMRADTHAPRPLRV